MGILTESRLVIMVILIRYLVAEVMVIRIKLVQEGITLLIKFQ